jgi:hypothetical protein
MECDRACNTPMNRRTNTQYNPSRDTCWSQTKADSGKTLTGEPYFISTAEGHIQCSWQDPQRDVTGHDSIEALVDQLNASDKWIARHSADSEGRLVHLFFAYTKTIQVFKSPPDILMADCTYRTNRFKMPLLHFIGCNSIGGHFMAAFCFMPSETQSDYYWALQHIRQLLYDPINCTPRVFLSDNEQALRSACGSVWPDVPQLLCLWHVNKTSKTTFRSTSNRP